MIKTIRKDRGGYGVEVIRLLKHFLDYGFHKVFCYKLKPYKDCATEFNRVGGDWSVTVEAASDLFNLMHREFIKLTGRDTGEISEGSTVSPNLPIILPLRRKSYRDLPQFTNLCQR